MSSDEAMTTLPPWVDATYRHAADLLDTGRMGHALLICGPGLIGKRLLAERMARRVLCLTPDTAGEACGRCKSCTLFPTGAHPDLRIVTREMNKEGTRLRADIVVEQSREIGSWLSLTSQLGGAQVVIVDPADAMNTAAANALLKTLEEPLPNRFLWLVSAQPSRLPATIRSRCQRLELHLPAHDAGLDWLIAQGHPRADADAALTAALGDPGQARHWLTSGGMQLRHQVESDLASLERGNTSAPELAQRWTADDATAQRLRFAADIALQRARRLTASNETRRLAGWFDQANRVRDLLRTTVRADLAVTALLLDWTGQLPQHRGEAVA